MLNANKVRPPASDKPRAPNLAPGTYPGRLVQIISLGVQKEHPYKGEEKAPRLRLYTTYEFSDEFLKDEEGKDILDKPRWLSEEFAFMSLRAEAAKSTLRYLALDPLQEHRGDWSQLAGAPAMITVVNEKDNRPDVDRIYDKIASVSTMRVKEAAKAPALVNTPKVFDFDAPDLEVFNALPVWLQDKIKDALNYDGSVLQAMLKEKPKPKAPVEDMSDDKTEDEISLDDKVDW
jgi:hypothetical protein